MEYLIETDNLTKRFGPLTAVEGLNIQVPRGTIFALLGPNGAGKTTTVRLLNGILQPTSGRAMVFGEDIRTRGTVIRRRCGVQTDTNLYEKLTVRDNLFLWGKLFEMDGSPLRSRTDALLEMFDLRDRQLDLAGNLSKGMKQKLSIARALIHDPEILFLDEPTAGLDPEAADEVLHYLARYVRDSNRTVFLCSHRLEEVEELSHDVTILFGGNVLASGELSDLVARIWPARRVIVRLRAITEPVRQLLEEAHREYEILAGDARLAVVIREDRDIAELIRQLASRDAGILEVREEKHTLKDVYLHFSAQVEHEHFTH